MVDSSTPLCPPIETFDPFTRNFAQNPYPVYAQLRNRDQAYFYEQADAWLLSKFEDVESAARHPKLVRSLDTFLSPEEVVEVRREANWHDMPNHRRFVQTSLLDSDGVVHDRLRSLILGIFSRSQVERHRSMIQKYVDGLLDQLLDKQEIDFVEDLAAQVPGRIIGNLLGIPDEDCPQLSVWSNNVVQFFDAQRTLKHKKLAEQATTEFYQYLLDLIMLRRRQPQEDLVSTLIQAKDSGRIDETELISTCMLILMAGHGSTIDVLGTGMYALLKHPTELDRLRQHPEYIHRAVQEMFRFDAPLPYFHRYAAEDVTVLDTRYPKGTKFGLLYGSANRDPDYFSNADKFDITRSPNRHIAFGRGAHLCLGNNLARLDMEVIFLTLLKRVQTIELMVEEPEFKPSLASRGLVALPLRLTLCKK